MTDTLSNVTLQENEWTDIYAATGISVGTKIAVENVGNADVLLTTLATQPPKDYNAYIVCKRNGFNCENDTGDSGAWAFCRTTSKINVRIV